MLVQSRSPSPSRKTSPDRTERHPARPNTVPGLLTPAATKPLDLATERAGSPHLSAPRPLGRASAVARAGAPPVLPDDAAIEGDALHARALAGDLAGFLRALAKPHLADNVDALVPAFWAAVGAGHLSFIDAAFSRGEADPAQALLAYVGRSTVDVALETCSFPPAALTHLLAAIDALAMPRTCPPQLARALVRERAVATCDFSALCVLYPGRATARQPEDRAALSAAAAEALLAHGRRQPHQAMLAAAVEADAPAGVWVAVDMLGPAAPEKLAHELRHALHDAYTHGHLHAAQALVAAGGLRLVLAVREDVPQASGHAPRPSRALLAWLGRHFPDLGADGDGTVAASGRW